MNKEEAWVAQRLGVANTILAQISLDAKMFAGTREYVAIDGNDGCGGVQFRYGKGRRYLRISLTPIDEYTVDVIYVPVRGHLRYIPQVKATYTNQYAEDLSNRVREASIDY